MRAPRFCSECGEKLIARSRRLRGRAFCKKCAPALWRLRFPAVAALALLIAISFAAGRYTGSSEPFYFIGTPYNPAPGSVRLAENNSPPAQQTAEPAKTERAETGTALCGAPTRSGSACRRRVRGGGYCFQHREKLKPAIKK